MATYSVDGAMAEALGHLNRISAHVRQAVLEKGHWLTIST